MSRITGSEVIENNIWLSKTTKYEGIYHEIAGEIAKPGGSPMILVAAHFEDCLEQLHLTLGEYAGDRVRIIEVSDLARHLSNPAFGRQDHTLLLIAERHPFHPYDDLVLQLFRSRPCLCRLCYHLSLEDFVLKRFVGERTKKILHVLDMEKNQPVKSRMLDCRIRKELNKIAKKIRGDLPARSPEEWFEKNAADFMN